MKVGERRREIARLVLSVGRIQAQELSERFGVNAETIRRDLAALESSGTLHRTHGGAMARRPLPPEIRVPMRVEERDAKFEIAKEASDLIPDSGVVFIEAGSTSSMLVDYLVDRPELLIVTNALQTALALTDRGAADVMTIGGRIRPQSYGEVGPWAFERLASLRFNVAFVGTNAIDFDWGMWTQDPSEAQIKAAIIASAETSVLLVDHTKFGLRAACRYGSVEDVEIVVSDHRLERSVVEDISALGIEMRVARPADPTESHP
ncbi:MAG: DeoR/GlpR family DNA-binding transcription regulator [Propionicimonas sp.]